MEVMYPKCAGLDVHKDTVVACARLVSGREVSQQVVTFGTTTKELLALSDWLTEQGCTHVAMEATGVYWKPIWHILEGSFELILANAMHIKNVPGRKTDVNDATWIADLLAHGLIRASFVPETLIQDLRTLTRTRKQLVREKARHVQRIQKALQDANLKITSAVSDIMGVSGRAILNALIEGETDPEKLVEAAGKRLRASRATLVEALRGCVTEHHRFMLKLHLTQIQALETAIGEVDGRVGSALEPFREAVEHLNTIPGVSDVVAQVIISEIGLDMSRFPTVAHLPPHPSLARSRSGSRGQASSVERRSAALQREFLSRSAWHRPMRATYNV